MRYSQSHAGQLYAGGSDRNKHSQFDTEPISVNNAKPVLLAAWHRDWHCITDIVINPNLIRNAYSVKDSITDQFAGVHIRS